MKSIKQRTKFPRWTSQKGEATQCADLIGLFIWAFTNQNPMSSQAVFTPEGRGLVPCLVLFGVVLGVRLPKMSRATPTTVSAVVAVP